MEVICEIADGKFTLGWKYTFTTARPAMDCDSICSTSLTVVVSAFSYGLTMRSRMSLGAMPV